MVAHIGVTERPPGSNRGAEIDSWNIRAGVPLGSPWCMSTVHAAYASQGVTLGGWASVGNFEHWAEAQGWRVGRPRKGDVVCFDWNGDNWPDHVGVIERTLALRWAGGRFVGWVQYVAGNDADQLRRNRRWVPASSRFARVPG